MIKVACIGDSITSGFTQLNPRRDGVHPQRKGTRKIAEHIFKALFKD